MSDKPLIAGAGIVPPPAPTRYSRAAALVEDYPIDPDNDLTPEDFCRYVLVQEDPQETGRYWHVTDSSIDKLLQYQSSDYPAWDPEELYDLETGDVYSINYKATLGRKINLEAS